MATDCVAQALSHDKSRDDSRIQYSGNDFAVYTRKIEENAGSETPPYSVHLFCSRQHVCGYMFAFFTGLV